MKAVPNILFIMYDQLRFDYLSCAGHPHLSTPNFDRVAARGLRFSNCHVQSPVCGSSRMSFYTGRYVSSHGAHWNGFPLRVGEHTLGDHLRRSGMDAVIIGKTHMKADAAGLERLGLAPDSIIGARQSQCGFDDWCRDDGLWGYGPDGYYDEKRSPYNEYLKAQGYDGENPWADYANAGIDEHGNMATGWILGNADRAANIAQEHSETPWLTREAIRFMEERKSQAAGQPWCAHVSYIKPHWPYMVPAPYHAMFGVEDVLPVNRHSQERVDAQAVYNAFMGNRIAAAFQQDAVRNTVIPAYMGLIRQCDDQLGVLLDHLEDSGDAENTVIVLTSDHGDYLGDHWLGEKDLFHEASVKVPLIIMDPSPAADSTRGTVCDALVEAIDVTASLIDLAGGEVPDHIVEGQSLVAYLHGDPMPSEREFVVSEYDYSATPMASTLGVQPRDARLFMVFDGRYKLMHAEGGFRPMLFDLLNDPHEHHDLMKHDSHPQVVSDLYAQLHQWGLRMSQRVTQSDQDILAKRGRSLRRGILPFLADGSEVDDELLSQYRGPARQRHITPDKS